MSLLDLLSQDISARPIYFVFSIIYVIFGGIFVALNAYGIYLLLEIRNKM